MLRAQTQVGVRGLKLGALTFISEMREWNWSLDMSTSTALRTIYARSRLLELKQERGNLSLSPAEQSIRNSVIYLRAVLDLFDALEYIQGINVEVFTGDEASMMRQISGPFQLPIVVSFVSSATPVNQMHAIVDPSVFNIIVGTVMRAAGTILTLLN